MGFLWVNAALLRICPKYFLRCFCTKQFVNSTISSQSVQFGTWDVKFKAYAQLSLIVLGLASMFPDFFFLFIQSANLQSSRFWGLFVCFSFLFFS